MSFLTPVIPQTQVTQLPSGMQILPVYQQPPTDTNTVAPGPSGVNNPAPAAPPNMTASNLSPSQIEQDVQSAVSGAVGSVGNSFTAGTLDNAINTRLASFGFGADLINAANQGEQAAEPHGSGFQESDKGGGGPFIASWSGNIMNSIRNMLAQAPNPTPQPTPIAEQPGGESTGVAGTATGEAAISSLVGANNAGTSNPLDLAGSLPGSGSIASMVPAAQTTSSGASPLMIIVILGIVAAVIGYVIYKNKHKKEAKPEEKTE